LQFFPRSKYGRGRRSRAGCSAFIFGPVRVAFKVGNHRFAENFGLD
jgi:hypothetical protein